MANDGHEEGSVPANSEDVTQVSDLHVRAAPAHSAIALLSAEFASRTPNCAAMPADAYIRLDDRVPSVVNPFVSTPFKFCLLYTSPSPRD